MALIGDLFGGFCVWFLVNGWKRYILWRARLTLPNSGIGSTCNIVIGKLPPIYQKKPFFALLLFLTAQYSNFNLCLIPPSK